MNAGVVCEVSFRCRDIGYGIEEGMITACWTGDIDCWGKYTFVQVGPPNAILYLFHDEIVSVEPVGASVAGE